MNAAIVTQIDAAPLTRPQRRLAKWLLADADDNGYTMHTPSQMTHILKGKDGPPGRVYGDVKPIHTALSALCRAGVLGFTWDYGWAWAQDVTVSFMAWSREQVQP